LHKKQESSTARSAQRRSSSAIAAGLHEIEQRTISYAIVNADKGDLEPRARSLFRHPGAKLWSSRIYTKALNRRSRHYWAVSKETGMGLFPTYACALGRKIVLLAIDLQHPFDIWLSYHDIWLS
jgi:hypothetical protein